MPHQDFTIEQLYSIMREVFHLRDFELQESMTSADVPGWDSLRHTMLTMQLSHATGADLSPDETARLANIGALYRHVKSRIPTG